MLSAVLLKNFKGIGAEVSVPLRPVTLLFGPNSAGKSTILHALLYLREILNTYNVDVDKTEAGGEAIDLGGFRSLVHLHQAETRKISIGVRLDRTMSQSDRWLYERSLKEAVNFTSTKPYWELQFEIAWQPFAEKPKLTETRIKSNEGNIATISSPADTKKTVISEINLGHPLLLTSSDEDRVREWHEESGDEDNFPELEIEYSLSEVFGNLWDFPLSRCHGALPRLDEELTFDEDDIYLEVHEGKRKLPLAEAWPDDLPNSYSEVRELLTECIVEPLRELKVALNSLLYLGPLREVPQRHFTSPRTQDHRRWGTGLGAWDVLASSDIDFVESVNSWLSSDEKLNAGYTLKVNRIKDLPVHHELYLSLMSGTVADDFDDIAAELNKLKERREVALLDHNTGTELLPQDIGTGISQVLPVIVAALQSRLSSVAIEQPELHIHPAMQVALGDLFLQAIAEGSKLFLIETHSEHLMLRILRRVRETTEGDIPPGIPEAKVDDISVIYVEEENSQVKLHQLRVSEDGDFKDRWPKGFFRERSKELF